MPPKSIRRNLFGATCKEETTAWLKEQERGYLNSKIKKWGFDFLNDCPLSDPSPSAELASIEAVGLDSVPSFYRPKTIPNKQSRKRKILLDDDSATKSLVQESSDHDTLIAPSVDVDVTPKKRRDKPVRFETPINFSQTKLSGGYVQVYKKRSNVGTYVEQKGFGGGDIEHAKRPASNSQTSVDHPPSNSSAMESEFGDNNNSEEKIEITPPVTRIRRSMLHRL